MYPKRPSQEKVVGVARRYLEFEEEQLLADGCCEYLETGEAGRLKTVLFTAIIAKASLARRCLGGLNSLRGDFLLEERAREGLKPGEEALVKYALGKLGPSEQEYFQMIQFTFPNQS